jgi:hypothetical protein
MGRRQERNGVLPFEVFVCGELGDVFEFELAGAKWADYVCPSTFVYCGSDRTNDAIFTGWKVRASICYWPVWELSHDKFISEAYLAFHRFRPSSPCSVSKNCYLASVTISYSKNHLTFENRLY